MLQQPTATLLEAEAPQPGPEAAADTAAAPTAAPAVRQFRFTGSASEYFGIWIVNLLLSILTLGIYSAWAKVRNKRYFYGHTVLDGAAFDYLASPIQILKGRAVIVGLFILYAVIVEFYPWFDLILFFAILPVATPWIVVRALKFNARYSSYRNLRFGFDGTTWEAFGVYVLLTAANVLTLGMLHPYTVYRRKRFQLEHQRFGRTAFSFDGSAGPLYKIYSVALCLALLPVVAGGLLLYASASSLVEIFAEQARASGADIGLATLGALCLVAGMLLMDVYLKTQVNNYVWSHAGIGEGRFRLDLRFSRMLWLRLSNLVAIVASFGLMIPWARVRTARYQVGQMALVTADGLERFIADERQSMAATGDEFGEALDLDLGL